jgi:hypothetical protein
VSLEVRQEFVHAGREPRAGARDDREGVVERGIALRVVATGIGDTYLPSAYTHAPYYPEGLSRASFSPGVRAVVWGVASILPRQCVELHRLLIDDIDLPAARELWARLWPLCQYLEGQSYSAAVKTACRLVCDTTGPVRAPLLPLDDGPTHELAALLEHATLEGAAR